MPSRYPCYSTLRSSLPSQCVHMYTHVWRLGVDVNAIVTLHLIYVGQRLLIEFGAF